MENQDLMKYIELFITAKVNQDAEMIKQLTEEGSKKTVTHSELAEAMTVVMSGVSTGITEVEDNVNFVLNTVVQALLDSEVIDTKVIDRIDELLKKEDNTEKEEENK